MDHWHFSSLHPRSCSLPVPMSHVGIWQPHAHSIISPTQMSHRFLQLARWNSRSTGSMHCLRSLLSWIGGTLDSRFLKSTPTLVLSESSILANDTPIVPDTHESLLKNMMGFHCSEDEWAKSSTWPRSCLNTFSCSFCYLSPTHILLSA